LLGDTVGTMFGVLLMVRLGALVAMRFLPDRPGLVLADCVLVGTRPSVSTAASRFSFFATVSVGVLAGSVVAMALRDVNLSAALGGSGYVRLLLCKLAAAAAMVGRGRDRDRRGGARVGPPRWSRPRRPTPRFARPPSPRRPGRGRGDRDAVTAVRRGRLGACAPGADQCRPVAARRHRAHHRLRRVDGPGRCAGALVP